MLFNIIEYICVRSIVYTIESYSRTQSWVLQFFFYCFLSVMKGLRHQKGRFAFLGVEKSGKTTLLRQLLEEGYVEPVPWTSKSIH
jgi:hypothetical protein